MRSRLVVFCFVCLVTASLLAAPIAASAVAPGLVVEADGESWGPAISDDGRYVAFLSDAGNLLGGDPASDTNGLTDVFVVDTLEGTIRLVSSGPGGSPADGPSTDVDISADGRYVVFETKATNLILGDENGVSDILLFDRIDGSLRLMSRRGTGGAQADAESHAPSISAAGDRVVFESHATNLIGTDTNSKPDIFLKDVTTGATSRVSTDSSGRQASNASYGSVIAVGGGFVAFSSIATNLVASDTNGTRDVFLKNLSTDKTTRISLRTDERQARGSSSMEDLSANGQYVAFSSYAPNLVKNDTNNQGDVFLRDRTAGTTIRISKDGVRQANADSFGASISGDGSFATFQTWATNLATGEDGNGSAADLFEYELATKDLTPLSVDASGGTTDAASYEAEISGDGLSVAFASLATDLVAGDLNSLADVFVHRWTNETRTLRDVARLSGGLPV